MNYGSIMKKRLMFIRHGQTNENIHDTIHKHSTQEEGLNEKGRAQIERLVSVCKKNKINTIYTSPEKRAVESAEILAKRLKLPDPIIIDNLREREWGQWQGKPWTEVETILSKMTLSERYTFKPKAGESWQEMDARLEKALNHILEVTSTRAAIVTHAANLRALIPIVKKAPKQVSFLYAFHNASSTIFDYSAGVCYEVAVNDVTHLGEFLQSCVFCQIISGKLPSHQIWENEDFLAFLSIFPNTEGFSVVIPKKHYSSYIFTLPDEVLNGYMQAIKQVAQLLETKLDDVGRTAVIFEGFGVDHAHAKLFPMHNTIGMKTWDKPKPKIKKYFKNYEGYVSSHSSNRVDDKTLAALMKKIKS